MFSLSLFISIDLSLNIALYGNVCAIEHSQWKVSTLMTVHQLTQHK